MAPIYEYKCTECGEKTQRIESFDSDSSGETCQSCGHGVIKRVFSVFGTGHSSSGNSCGAPSGSPFS